MLSIGNVVSTFDGISCGQMSLVKAKISYDRYISIENDKTPIAITQRHFPDTEQFGDITEVRSEDLPRTGLLLGGSPCQGFSFSGKQLNFKDPRSKLFFEFARLNEELMPRYFLLENVKMKKEYQDVISSYLGVQPILVNSNKVSAQNRPRLYWTNIPNISQPEDKGIYLEDILEDKVQEKYTIPLNKYKGSLVENYLADASLGLFPGPACLTERRTAEARRLRREHRIKFGVDFSPRRAKELVPRTDGKINCLTRSMSSKEHAIIDKNGVYRELTPIEWERAQNLPDNYTAGFSDYARRQMLGNGWTIDVIVHFLKHIPKWTRPYLRP